MNPSQIKPVTGGEPVAGRKALPEGPTFRPFSRMFCDGRPSERWDGEKWVVWDRRNNGELGQ